VNNYNGQQERGGADEAAPLKIRSIQEELNFAFNSSKSSSMLSEICWRREHDDKIVVFISFM
jgi:hypothetical protein